MRRRGAGGERPATGPRPRAARIPARARRGRDRGAAPTRPEDLRLHGDRSHAAAEQHGQGEGKADGRWTGEAHDANRVGRAGKLSKEPRSVPFRANLGAGNPSHSAPSLAASLPSDHARPAYPARHRHRPPASRRRAEPRRGERRRPHQPGRPRRTRARAGRHHRDPRQADDGRRRAPAVPAGRRPRHHPARRAPADERAGRPRRPRRDPEGRDPAGEEGHRRPGAEEHPAHRPRRGADADAPRPPAHRRRRDLDERLPQAAGDGRRAVPRGGHARVLPAARLRPARDPADGDLDEPARHRAGHAGDRDRAAPAVRRARGGHAARHHLRRRRRARQDDRPGARDGRAPAQAPRAVLPPRHRPAEGRAALRPARHRQDPPRPRRRRRERRAVLPHRRARDHGQVLRRERGPPAGDLRGRAEERAVVSSSSTRSTRSRRAGARRARSSAASSPNSSR